MKRGLLPIWVPRAETRLTVSAPFSIGEYSLPFLIGRGKDYRIGKNKVFWFVSFSGGGIWETYVSEIINEEYDIIEDDGRRLKFLCDEIDRLHNKPIEEIHELYLSVKDKLIHNRKVFLDLADKDCWTSYFDEVYK